MKKIFPYLFFSPLLAIFLLVFLIIILPESIEQKFQGFLQFLLVFGLGGVVLLLLSMILYGLWNLIFRKTTSKNASILDNFDSTFSVGEYNKGFQILYPIILKDKLDDFLEIKNKIHSSPSLFKQFQGLYDSLDFEYSTYLSFNSDSSFFLEFAYKEKKYYHLQMMILLV